MSNEGRRKLLLGLSMIMLVAALVSGYKLFVYFYEGMQGEKYIADLKEDYYASDQDDGEDLTLSPEEKRRQKFKFLQNINSDIVGWVRVPGTRMDYPVVQGVNNDFYLRRNLEKAYAIRGSIFMDHTSSAKADGLHTIIYGHNMKDGTMFGHLPKYKKRDFFEENRLVEYDFPDGNTEWEIFSAYIYVLGENNFRFELEDEEDLAEYIKEVGRRSMHKSNMATETWQNALERLEAGEEVKMMTLLSCTYEYDNSRLILHAISK